MNPPKNEFLYQHILSTFMQIQYIFAISQNLPIKSAEIDRFVVSSNMTEHSA